ncbi:WD repeat-containing protein 20 [Halotydeus destructor]|nr:WD repeat-containing protein 20 [Halotydeus destructor]
MPSFASNSLTGASGDSLGGLTGKEDLIKNQFATREGVYKLMTSGEYSRPSRVGYAAQVNNTPVKISFVTMPDLNEGSTDKICFNVGRELFIYNYKGTKKAADLTKPVDKRVYKGTFPTFHDFNQFAITHDGLLLLIGFSAGQIQLIDPIKKEFNKLYNEERLIDKTKVTCLRWIPGSDNLFLVSHASGQLYVYREDLPCGTTPPTYQVFKQGDGYCVYTCKTKSTRNPLYRWVIGDGSINEFAFSPCSKYLAVVSQDGFLRVFHYDTLELVGRFRSYFGGLLCLSWSPDGMYIVTGGEDDLVSVYSIAEKRVVARGQGHKSWVSVVAFDPFTTSYSEQALSGSDENLSHVRNDNFVNLSSSGSHSSATANHNNSFRSTNGTTANVASYRFGSIGQDTHLCLWDLTDDVLKQPVSRSRASILISSPSQLTSLATNHVSTANRRNSITPTNNTGNNTSDAANANHLGVTNSSKGFVESKKEHKRSFSLASRHSDKNSVNKTSHTKLMEDPVKLLGTPSCPRLDEVPMLEPLICKKISHERLTALVFREDCFVTACLEGYVCTWARPGKYANSQLVSSPTASVSEGDPIDETNPISRIQ